MKRYRFRVAGDGACLFVSLRLGLEIVSVLQQKSSQAWCLKSSCDHINEDAARLRKLLVKWYEDGEALVPQLGRFDEASGAPWSRAAIISTELAKKNAEATPAAARAYLESMLLKTTWGSTPEYTAFSLINGRAVAIWQRMNGTLKCVDFVAGKMPQLNLFFENNHYEPLVNEEEKAALEAIGPIDVVEVK